MPNKWCPFFLRIFAKMKKVFSTKDIAYSVKDMDMKQGIVQLYASTFDKLDDDGDVMRRGAFTKTIQENGVEGKNRIKQLCLLYTSPSPRDGLLSRMPSSA